MKKLLSVTIKIIIRIVLIIAASFLVLIFLYGYDMANVMMTNFGSRFKYELGKIYYGRDGEKAANWRKKAAEQEERRAYKMTDIVHFKQAKESAKAGNAESQFKLAGMYYRGQGVKQNYAEAVNWYQKASEQGFKAAQEMLDKITEYEQIKKSAEEGNAESQFKLAEMYYRGQDVKQDYAEAVKLYQKAADQGHKEAKKIVDAIHFEQTKKTTEESQIKLAKENQIKLAAMYYYGIGVNQDYAEAAIWYGKAAEQGIADAQYALGGMYYDGRGVEQDYAEAVIWYRKAAEQGIADAQYALGGMYYDGRGVEQRYSGAVNWYKKAAEQGFADAQYTLGGMYYDALGVIQDYDKAFNWYQKAAEQGIADAQYALGGMYYLGEGVKQDYVEAMNWYKKAEKQWLLDLKRAKDVKQKLADVQYVLGTMYYKGEGVEQDYVEAMNWYKKSAKNESAEAQNKLDEMYGYDYEGS
ncbi:MAG: hypothetical protein FWD54_03535 [Endomicrobia bacterium]|nr:hypothetical protein [Endomicrobiia bacterium]MCL2799334.1 hypothetical protein [Endomicrobiia bacterium]